MITSHQLLANAFRTYVLLKENDVAATTQPMLTLLVFYCTYSKIAVNFL